MATKYKLLGFTRTPLLSASIMVLSTGKTIRMGLKDLVDSEIFDELDRNEQKSVYRKFYGGKGVKTMYDIADRNERSWNAYILICIALTALFLACTLTGIKPVRIESLHMTIPAAIFVYPLTFILIDILNEFYGLRKARQAIFGTFIANLLFVGVLWFSTKMNAIPGWGMDSSYDSISYGITSVFIASSLSYLLSENINSYLLCKIKALTNSRYLFIRVIASTTVAAAVDSITFITIAFHGVLSMDIMMTMIISQFVIKITYAIVGVFPIYGTRWLFRHYINVPQNSMVTPQKEGNMSYA
ncbi:queuosine precursor transporter [Dongshaea marina]|uniref:queuosine precursor transporter n=1 Tax=Dongshaea marina TaxID=2047966 RepID=UPI000D3EBF38|nr:queuosine precursor transporter [Dongshaea marina]